MNGATVLERTATQGKSSGSAGDSGAVYELQDARYLLDFAICQGFTTSDGRKVDDGLINRIVWGESRIGDDLSASAEDRAEFAKAYRDLALFTAPVTAQTLRATSPEHGRRTWLSPFGKRMSEATIWSRKLTLWTLYFISLSILGELFKLVPTQYLPALDEVRNPSILPLYYLGTLLDILTPFTYGGIGACVFLLRSCHKYIYTRQFDPNRIPEYYNRMILGIVSGGAITMFISQIPMSADGKAPIVRLSAAALGFLAGYNSDFLFNTVDRVMATILPKVGIETVQTAQARTVASGTATSEMALLKDVLDRYAATTDDEQRILLASLIEKLRDRL